MWATDGPGRAEGVKGLGYDNSWLYNRAFVREDVARSCAQTTNAGAVTKRIEENTSEETLTFTRMLNDLPHRESRHLAHSSAGADQCQSTYHLSVPVIMYLLST